MTSSDLATASLPSPLTPRQDRLEAALLRVLRTNGTRSELRAIVYELVDHYRLQGMPLHQTADEIKRAAARAASSVSTNATAVGDSLADRMMLIARWCAVRYGRAD